MPYTHCTSLLILATLCLQAKQQLEMAVQQAGQQANQRQASLAGAAEELQEQLAAAREAADQSRRELESVKKEVAVAVNDVLLQVGGVLMGGYVQASCCCCTLCEPMQGRGSVTLHLASSEALLAFL
jgi:hypothetical protein